MPYARAQRLEPVPPLARLRASVARALPASAATARSGASDRRRTPWRPRCGFQAMGSAIFPLKTATLTFLKYPFLIACVETGAAVGIVNRPAATLGAGYGGVRP